MHAYTTPYPISHSPSLVNPAPRSFPLFAHLIILHESILTTKFLQLLGSMFFGFSAGVGVGNGGLGIGMLE